MPDAERVISVVKLPDGRFAVQNEQDVGGLTDEDRDQMADALLLWFGLHPRVQTRGEAT